MSTHKHQTVALSLIVHGEAVRFNRGKTRGDDYDFKYMRGTDGKIYPYVSSQCFKKYWREALPGPPSPITREKDAKGKEKNQAFTSGDPIRYADDDLFGYMIAGASEEEAATTESAEGETIVVSPEEEDASFDAISFSADQLKGDKSWVLRLKDKSALSEFIVLHLSPSGREMLEAAGTSKELQSSLKDEIADALNAAIADLGLFTPDRFSRKLLKTQQKSIDSKDPGEIRQVNYDILREAFKRELETKSKRPTTKRTAPVRMHALVGFSGIKTAKDFQTFSRDVNLTGKNSILNPSPVGIYSGWLKTRILIEAHRIGKFYVGANKDLLDDQVLDKETVKKETDPYSRTNEQVTFIEMSDHDRGQRLRDVLVALADVGNKQGPASGALHDGSLKPKAFIAAFMNCADSPLDAVWQPTDDVPRLDITRLKAALSDWEDLFTTPKVYIGIPVEGLPAEGLEEYSKYIKAELSGIRFEAVVGTPRLTLLQMAKDAAI